MDEKDSIPLPTDPRFINLTGHKYGLLTVRAYAGKRGRKHYWYCVCDCGGVSVADGGNLRYGDTTSCGCERKRRASETKTKHGMRQSPEYVSYTSAKSRCKNPRNSAYRHYGGRGITFDFASFEEFYAALGPRPSPEHSVDRINNELGYSANNCRWATSAEQSRNRRVNTGLAQAIEDAGGAVSQSTAHNRITLFGWCFICSVSTPPRGEKSCGAKKGCSHRPDHPLNKAEPVK